MTKLAFRRSNPTMKIICQNPTSDWRQSPLLDRCCGWKWKTGRSDVNPIQIQIHSLLSSVEEICFQSVTNNTIRILN